MIEGTGLDDFKCQVLKVLASPTLSKSSIRVLVSLFRIS